ncbi:MAG: PspC domain-containing protein [Saprospiraceae bacterium]|nr:PspC domain-containing protein [Saprospiraceae bacterium]
MNKTFNINLGSYPFAIDEDAYNYVQHYLDTIRKHFSTSDGCDEILYDIEVRMAELFQEHLKGRAIISMKEIDEVIMIMGKPEDFGAEPMTEGAYTSSRNKKNDFTIKTGKRLFRDPDDKKLAGVCSGIAAYFGVEDPLWVRLIFALMFFTGGIGFVTYMILWILIPEAGSAGDKLAMRGEPTTIQNIAKVVEDELSEFGVKINEWSKDLGSKKKSGDENPGFHAKSMLSGAVNIFGTAVGGILPVMRQILKPMFLVISIIILSALGITWAASFIGATFAAPTLAFAGPDSTSLAYLGIGSGLITLGLPILGVMLLISRLAFSYRINRKVKTGLWTVWFLSLFTMMFAGMNTIKEYSTSHAFSTTMDYNIDSKDVKLMMPEENLDHSFGVHLGQIFVEKDDKWAVRDVNIRIEKSKDALIHIEKNISSRGSNDQEAQANALYISNDVKVEGNEIKISKFILIPKNKKFRNQKIDYVVYIPEGKNVILDNNVKESMRDSDLFSYDQIFSGENMTWTITSDGIKSPQWEEAHNYKKDVVTGIYSKVIIEKGFDVIIQKADKSNVTFAGNKEVVDRIIQKNLDGTLTINADDSEDLDGISIIIQTPSIELIHLDGVKSAKIEGFSQDNLKLVSKGDYDGSGETSVEFFGNVKNIDISLDGEQMLKMTGSGETIALQINNGAEIQADKYIVKSATLIGDCDQASSMHVTETFSNENPEELSIKLIGNPKKIKI